jgi:long-chain acyl-CoA synthetase
MEGNLSWPLSAAIRSHGANIAIIEGTRQLTYRQLGERASRLGPGLDNLGIGLGDTVAVLMGNKLEHLEAWLAVPAQGRVISSLNTRLSEQELGFMLKDSGARVLIVDEHHLALGKSLRSQCPELRHLILAGADAQSTDDVVPYDAFFESPPQPFPDSRPDDVAALMYTGGTTGKPKGVMLTHRNLLANAKHLWHTVGLRRADRFLHAGPLFHAATSQFVHPHTWVGGTHVVIPRFEPMLFAQAVAEHRATASLLVPTMIQTLLSHLREHPTDLSSLRLLHYGASPMSAKLLREAMDVLGCDFIQGYGMTETGPGITFLSAEDHRLAASGDTTRLGSVGYAIPGVQMQIRDSSGTPLQDGEIGEVWARGPNIMKGYFNRPDETNAVFVDGWFRTGDGGYCDSDGYLFLVDRLKDMIVTGGENVYSIEVEQVIASHPAVAEVAVLGVPDESWGERVHAIVVLQTGHEVTEQELTDHCRQRIGRYKVPKSWEIRTAPLPKSGVGKIRKKDLREEACSPAPR